MAELRHDKKETIRISEPLINVGKHEGGKYDPQKNVTVFQGEVSVSPAIAEDLYRRQEAWDDHQRKLHLDNGKRDLNAGGFTGGQL